MLGELAREIYNYLSIKKSVKSEAVTCTVRAPSQADTRTSMLGELARAIYNYIYGATH